MRHDEVVEPLPRAWEERPELRGRYASRIPDEIREAAVELALQLKSGRKAAQHLGIPARTVQFWLAEAVVSDVDAWNLNAIKAIESKIEQVLARIGPDKIDKAGLRDLVLAAGILLDKRQQMIPKARGESPQRLRIAWKDGSGAVEVETGG